MLCSASELAATNQNIVTREEAAAKHFPGSVAVFVNTRGNKRYKYIQAIAIVHACLTLCR